MSEDAIKARLRERKRREASPEVPGSLASQGYAVTAFEAGPFHLEARRGTSSKRIRLCFSFPDKGDFISVARECVPPRCQREIWYIPPDGRRTIIANIDGILK